MQIKIYCRDTDKWRTFEIEGATQRDTFVALSHCRPDKPRSLAIQSLISWQNPFTLCIRNPIQIR